MVVLVVAHLPRLAFCAIFYDAHARSCSSAAQNSEADCAFQCRCGPFPPALQALQDARVKRLVAAMVTAEYAINQGVDAIEKAKTKGVLKVVITMDD